MKFIVISFLMLSSFAQSPQSVEAIQQMARNYKGTIGKVLDKPQNSDYGYLSTIVNLDLKKRVAPLPLIHRKVFLDVKKLEDGPVKDILQKNLGKKTIPFTITFHPKQKLSSSDLMVNIPGTFAKTDGNTARHVAFQNAHQGKVVVSLPNPISKEFYKLSPQFDFGDIAKYSDINLSLIHI